jgi:hypothetical protein
MIAPLLLEPFARRREIVAAADRASAPCFAFVNGSHESLLLGREIRDRAIERRCTLPRLIQLRAAGAEFGFRVGKELLPASGFGLRLRTRFLEALELKTRVGQRLPNLVGATGGCLRGFAQALDLVAPRNDADLRIVAAIHTQPTPPDPYAFTSHERLAVGQLGAARDSLGRGLRNAHAA